MNLIKKKDRLLLCAAVFLGGINAFLSAFISILLQQIIDAATTKDLQGFKRLFIAALIYLAVLGLIGFVEAYCGKLLIRNISQHLRDDIFHGVMRMSPESYNSINTADYLSALINDVKLIEENYLLPLLMSSQMVVLFLTTLGVLLYLSPVVTVVLLVFLILMFLVPALLGRQMQKKQDAYSEKLAEFTAKAKDFLNGYEIIRGYSISSYILRKFSTVNKDTAAKKFAADRLLAVNECFSDILSALSVLVIVFLAAWLMLKGEITMGTLLALIQLSGTFVTPVVMLMQSIPKIASMKPVIERLTELSNIQLPPCDGQTRQSHTFSRELTCSQLSFGYTEGQDVLKNLTFTIKAGEKYALLGESGSGKSTLIKLLTGYTHNFRGDILYDGMSIREMSQSEINQLVAVIHQNVFLFDTDIYDNICLGDHFSESMLNQALENSGVTQFLDSLTDGIHTQVGENGQNLSGGQRQRIAVARALIRRTPILILDEGTSAVDQETAHEIEGKLLCQKELTVITITHHMDQKLLPFYDGTLSVS